MPVDVLCIGAVGWDYSVYMDGFPVENQKYEASGWQEAGGGPAANAAYLLSAWGISCAFAGLIGDDDAGRKIMAEFQNVGANSSLMEVRTGHLTSVSTVLVNTQTSTRTIINHKPERLAPFHLNRAFLAGESPRILLLDGHELLASTAAIEAFPHAITVLDAGSWRQGTADLASRVTYLVASERFATQATGRERLGGPGDIYAAVGDLRARSGSKVVVTLGERGLAYDFGDGGKIVPAFPVRAVDTTAAGDIFHGAFVYGLLRQMEVPGLLRFASMAAAISVTRPGGRQSIPARSEVEKAMRRAG